MAEEWLLLHQSQEVLLDQVYVHLLDECTEKVGIVKLHSDMDSEKYSEITKSGLK
jgi:hypothetical protein